MSSILDGDYTTVSPDATCLLVDPASAQTEQCSRKCCLKISEVAVKRYFTSKNETEIRKSKHRDSVHKQDHAKYERNKEKLRRSLLACDKNTLAKDKQMMVGDLLRSIASYKYMSSDEEGEEGK